MSSDVNTRPQHPGLGTTYGSGPLAAFIQGKQTIRKHHRKKAKIETVIVEDSPSEKLRGEVLQDRDREDEHDKNDERGNELLDSVEDAYKRPYRRKQFRRGSNFQARHDIRTLTSISTNGKEIVGPRQERP